jgi:hypothetical protein
MTVAVKFARWTEGRPADSLTSSWIATARMAGLAMTGNFSTRTLG